MSKVQLVVEYADHQTRYYPANRGWRVDSAWRCIVIGTDLPRTYVPLDQVVAFHVEHVAPREQASALDQAAAHPVAAASNPEPNGQIARGQHPRTPSEDVTP